MGYLLVEMCIRDSPKNDWRLTIPDGICIDIVPLADQRWAVRPYGFDDTFKG